jgi:very-short-patch-repair endonuclease
MATRDAHSSALALAARQHYVVSHEQLHSLGFTRAAIRHALSNGRFHPQRAGIVAIGPPKVEIRGRLMAVVLAYPEAAISHTAAAVLWEIHKGDIDRIDATFPADRHPRARDLAVHRRDPMPAVTRRHGIAVTRPLETLVDLAASCSPDIVEAAVNEADRLGVLRMDRAVKQLARMTSGRGTRALARILDRHTVTDSTLEKRFLQIVRELGLPRPLTQKRLNGFRVDFFWPDLGLVVETDGLTYHRTPAQQAKDRRRDQVHTAAGLTCLRFTNAQIRGERESVRSILATVAARLA